MAFNPHSMGYSIPYWWIKRRFVTQEAGSPHRLYNKDNGIKSGTWGQICKPGLSKMTHHQKPTKEGIDLGCEGQGWVSLCCVFIGLN